MQEVKGQKLNCSRSSRNYCMVIGRVGHIGQLLMPRNGPAHSQIPTDFGHTENHYSVAQMVNERWNNTCISEDMSVFPFLCLVAFFFFNLGKTLVFPS